MRRLINRVAPPVAAAREHLDGHIERRGWRPASLGLWAVLALAMACEAHVRWLFAGPTGVVFVHQQIPEWLIISLWAVTGCYALRGAFTRKDEHVADGFFTLAFMPGAYAGSYLWAGFTTPDWRPAFFALSVWLPLSLIVYISATYERPKKLAAEDLGPLTPRG